MIYLRELFRRKSYIYSTVSSCLCVQMWCSVCDILCVIDVKIGTPGPSPWHRALTPKSTEPQSASRHTRHVRSLPCRPICIPNFDCPIRHPYPARIWLAGGPSCLLDFIIQDHRRLIQFYAELILRSQVFL